MSGRGLLIQTGLQRGLAERAEHAQRIKQFHQQRESPASARGKTRRISAVAASAQTVTSAEAVTEPAASTSTSSQMRVFL